MYQQWILCFFRSHVQILFNSYVNLIYIYNLVLIKLFNWKEPLKRLLKQQLLIIYMSIPISPGAKWASWTSWTLCTESRADSFIVSPTLIMDPSGPYTKLPLAEFTSTASIWLPADDEKIMQNKNIEGVTEAGYQNTNIHQQSLTTNSIHVEVKVVLPFL